MRTRAELIAENCKLNTEIAINILKLQTLSNEIDDLKRENIVLKLKLEKKWNKI